MASLYVSYFGSQDENAIANPISSEIITTSVTSAAGGAIPAGALYAALWSTVVHFATVGTGTPTASQANSMAIPGNWNTIIRLPITNGTALKIAAITG